MSKALVLLLVSGNPSNSSRTSRLNGNALRAKLTLPHAVLISRQLTNDRRHRLMKVANTRRSVALMMCSEMPSQHVLCNLGVRGLKPKGAQATPGEASLNPLADPWPTSAPTRAHSTLLNHGLKVLLHISRSLSASTCTPARGTRPNRRSSLFARGPGSNPRGGRLALTSRLSGGSHTTRRAPDLPSRGGPSLCPNGLPRTFTRGLFGPGTIRPDSTSRACSLRGGTPTTHSGRQLRGHLEDLFWPLLVLDRLDKVKVRSIVQEHNHTPLLLSVHSSDVKVELARKDHNSGIIEPSKCTDLEGRPPGTLTAYSREVLSKVTGLSRVRKLPLPQGLISRLVLLQVLSDLGTDQSGILMRSSKHESPTSLRTRETQSTRTALCFLPGVDLIIQAHDWTGISSTADKEHQLLLTKDCPPPAITGRVGGETRTLQQAC